MLPPIRSEIHLVIKRHSGARILTADTAVLLRERLEPFFLEVFPDPNALVFHSELAGHGLLRLLQAPGFSGDGPAGAAERFCIAQQVQETLPQNFRRCNSCYLVNLNYVTKLQDVFVYLGETRLQISQHKRTEFVHALNNFLNNDTGD